MNLLISSKSAEFPRSILKYPYFSYSDRLKNRLGCGGAQPLLNKPSTYELDFQYLVVYESQ